MYSISMVILLLARFVKKGALLLLCTAVVLPNLTAQWVVPLPEAGTGAFAITDTIYMSPSGQDDWPGTREKPVLTFQKALQLLPFGSPGIAAGHAYGLVRLLPGIYNAPNGMQQGETQWKKGNTYKNVSLEGIGNAIIQGNANAPGIIHGVRLMGDHFYVKNVSITQFTGIGLFIQRPVISPDEAGPSHVSIERVTVDSTGSHGALIVNADIVHVRESKILRGSRLNFNTQPQLSCTAWPSGLKFHFSKQILAEDNEVAFTRGEGLNFHNCERAIARRNRLHDNLTNLYNDNSARLSVYENYIFNSPGFRQYAYPCPQLLNEKRLSGTGILLGNEGSCLDAAHSPLFQNCNAVQCGALLVPAYRFPTIDSVFIYNNIIHRCGDGIDFWQGNTDIVGPNCISNVFVFNNSLFEVSGDKEAQGAQVKLFFPVFNFLLNSYGRLKNVVFHGNLISYNPAQFPAVKPFRASFNSQVSQQITFQHNLWTASPDNISASDIVTAGAILSAPIDSIHIFNACQSQVLTSDVPLLFPWLKADYLGQPRRSDFTQAGAIERACASSTEDAGKPAELAVWPNPSGLGQVVVHSVRPCLLTFYGLDGRVALSHRMVSTSESLDVSHLPPGMYIVSDGRTAVRWVAVR